MVVVFYVVLATIAFVCRTTTIDAVTTTDEYDKLVEESNKYSKNEIRSPRKVEKVRINDLLWEIEVLWPTEKTFINKTYAVYDDNKIIKDGPFDHYDDGKSKQIDKTVTVQRDGEDVDRYKPEAIGGNQELMSEGSSSENGVGRPTIIASGFLFLLITTVFIIVMPFWFDLI